MTKDPDPPDSALERLNIHQASGIDIPRSGIWPSTHRAIENAGYLPLKPLSTGGSAEVWTASPTHQSRRLAVEVAIKVIKNPNDSDMLRMFEHEVKTLNSDRVPRDVAPMFRGHRDVDDRSAPTVQPFLVMELIRGEPIVEYAEHLPDPVARLELVARTYEALQKLHDHNINHGDISHNNEIVESDGRIRIIDYGGAKPIFRNGTISISLNVGTQHCAPPSFLLGQAKLEPWVDIHAQSSVAFRVLTGKWPDKNPGAPPRNVRLLRASGIPDEIGRIILKGLREKRPRLDVDPDLYESPGKAAAELRRGLKRLGDRNRRKSRVGLMAAVLVPAILAASIAWWIRLGAEREDRARRIRSLKNDPVVAVHSGDPLIQKLSEECSRLEREYNRAVARGPWLTIDTRAETLLAALARRGELARGLDRSLPYRKSLGDMLLGTPWVKDAPKIQERCRELEAAHARIGELLAAGETDEAWRRLPRLHEDLIKALRTNIAATAVLEPRDAWRRLNSALPARLRERGENDPALAEARRYATDADAAWGQGDWTLADRSYRLGTQAMERWLADKETPAEFAARRPLDHAEVAALIESERKSKQDNARLERLGIELRSRVAELTAERDAVRAEVAAKDGLRLKAESDYASAKAEAGRLAAGLSRVEAELAFAMMELVGVSNAPPNLALDDEWAGSEAGELKVVTYKNFPIRFRWCPPGRFKIGSPSNETGRLFNEDQRDALLTKGFWVMETEVTQGLWRLVFEAGLQGWKQSPGSGDTLPAYSVSHTEALMFCVRLTDRLREEGLLPQGFRLTLPTFAQWEYMARAGAKSRFHHGDDEERLPFYAWYDGNARGEVHPVAKLKPNAWGIYDTLGNVYEWTFDDGADDTLKGVDPVGGLSGHLRSVRGGGWYDYSTCSRLAYHYEYHQIREISDVGFRVIAIRE